MGSRVGAGARGAADAWAQVARSGPLRRAQLSFAAMWAGEAAVLVALGVVAFRDGGVAAVGIVTALRMAPAALLAPFASAWADVVRRERVLAWVGYARAVTLACAAGIIASDGPTLAVYGVIVVATVAFTLYRPAHSALLPALCRSPQELASANVVRGLLDSAATLAGPLVAAVLLAASGPAAVFAACAAASLWAGAIVARLRYDAPPRASGPDQGGRALVRGLALLVSEPRLRTITAIGVAQTVTRGALNVLLVVVAIDLLDVGDAGVGWLNAAVGAGGVLGAFVALTAVRGGRLGTGFGFGIALFGAPLIVLGILPDLVAAVVLLGLIGLGNALIDACGFTLLARLTDEAVLARMFAGFEAVLTLGVAAGGLLAPLVVEVLGLRWALVAVGLIAPLAVAAAWPALRGLDRLMTVRDVDIAVLRAIPMLRSLPAATIEQLGGRLEREEYAPGEVVFEQGMEGDRFYAVEAGSAEVLRDGRAVGLLGPGECFGEIALLRDAPRTATVRAAASGSLRVSALPRCSFLTAVTGYPASAAAGERVVTRRLDALGRENEPPVIASSAEVDTA
ncbi:MAG TPA: MFS transporter [Solirubrobacteraceae bacterium]|nr:MFS transporter [Solirubrobacteraceae bacterium]